MLLWCFTYYFRREREREREYKHFPWTLLYAVVQLRTKILKHVYLPCLLLATLFATVKNLVSVSTYSTPKPYPYENARHRGFQMSLFPNCLPSSTSWHMCSLPWMHQQQSSHGIQSFSVPPLHSGNANSPPPPSDRPYRRRAITPQSFDYTRLHSIKYFTIRNRSVCHILYFHSSTILRLRFLLVTGGFFQFAMPTNPFQIAMREGGTIWNQHPFSCEFTKANQPSWHSSTQSLDNAAIRSTSRSLLPDALYADHWRIAQQKRGACQTLQVSDARSIEEPSPSYILHSPTLKIIAHMLMASLVNTFDLCLAYWSLSLFNDAPLVDTSTFHGDLRKDMYIVINEIKSA